MESIIQEVKIIKNYIQKSEIKNLYLKDKEEYEKHLKQKFSNLSNSKPFLFDMAISYEHFDFKKLKNFLSIINNIKKGKMTSDSASKMVGQMQYDEYVKNNITDESNTKNTDESNTNEAKNKINESVLENNISKKTTDLEYI